ncbi:MAG: Holliday junction resolvase RuvX [Rhodocyclaceae bacterium]|nr:Holliday junction resolvase RuvX [Rhodocyclaceae bacterium]MDZ4216032.1 Holliday junction resolvase RuvX [Rhodocyclaceae bacterium]
MLESETVMAFDFGEKRIGVAIGETLLGEARALATVAESANDRRFTAIAKLIAEWHPARLVVGLPRHADDAEHEFAARCERFARQLEGRYHLPVERVDERYSSAIAESQLTGDKRDRKARLDAEAAAVILQAWLDQRHALTSISPSALCH